MNRLSKGFLSVESDSKFLGVSVRGWIALIVVINICVMSLLKIDVNEPMYSLVGMVVGFYFGQKKSGGENGNQGKP